MTTDQLCIRPKYGEGWSADMPFAKISEKRLAKTISIAVSGFCLYRIYVYDVPNALCYIIMSAFQYMVTINPHIHSVLMFQTISMMEPSIIVNKHRFCR